MQMLLMLKVNVRSNDVYERAKISTVRNFFLCC